MPTNEKKKSIVSTFDRVAASRRPASICRLHARARARAVSLQNRNGHHLILVLRVNTISIIVFPESACNTRPTVTLWKGPRSTPGENVAIPQWVLRLNNRKMPVFYRSCRNPITYEYFVGFKTIEMLNKTIHRYEYTNMYRYMYEYIYICTCKYCELQKMTGSGCQRVWNKYVIVKISKPSIFNLSWEVFPVPSRTESCHVLDTSEICFEIREDRPPDTSRLSAGQYLRILDNQTSTVGFDRRENQHTAATN